jgi:hypothetical protein
MAGVKVRVRGTATRLESDSYPRWIEVSVHDSGGNEHLIVEKVPVLTLLDIRSDSPFPIELWIDAEVKSIAGDEVLVAFSYGVETTTREQELTVSSADVVWPDGVPVRDDVEFRFNA